MNATYEQSSTFVDSIGSTDIGLAYMFEEVEFATIGGSASSRSCCDWTWERSEWAVCLNVVYQSARHRRQPWSSSHMACDEHLPIGCGNGK